MRTPLIAGNWKMNGSRASVKELLNGVVAGITEVKRAAVAVCVPYIYIPEVASRLQGTPVAWGAQNVSTESKGAYTGEIAAAMLMDFGCRYVIVGHSERRTLYAETDAGVAKKYGMVTAAGMTPIFCLGETLEERERGVTEQVVTRQLKAVIDMHGVKALQVGVIAYEPVWAIGTGKTATPQQAQAVHAYIRGRIAEYDKTVAAAVLIQYGGSMNAQNAEELLAMPDIDGGLIGGASLKADDFLTICKAANR
ncbi:MAG: triose-phosphate isomerase [Gammaproteobacteria bacterium]|nr:triose-phosphate isomerase [Gammaproteobacteria bacterium]